MTGEAEFLHCVLSYKRWQTLWGKRRGAGREGGEEREEEEGEKFKCVCNKKFFFISASLLF